MILQVVSDQKITSVWQKMLMGNPSVLVRSLSVILWSSALMVVMRRIVQVGCYLSVLPIKRGIRDNLGIIFHITPLKHTL